MSTIRTANWVRTYIHRILDTSNEMLAELVQLQGKAQKLKSDLGKLPSTFDAEWEKRYTHLKVLVDNLIHDMARCVTLVTERGDLGEEILAIWFPEEVEEDELPPPSDALQVTPLASPARKRCQWRKRRQRPARRIQWQNLARRTTLM